MDLSRLHEEILVVGLLPRCPSGERAAVIRRASTFFAHAVTSWQTRERSGPEMNTLFNGFIETLSRRTAALAALNLKMRGEIRRHRTTVAQLRTSQRRASGLLVKSRHLQEELQRLSRRMVASQEEERRRISRELHDVIAQSLTAINLRLGSLKRTAGTGTHDLDASIEQTRSLVEQSVNIIHRFARELRPTILDDLGLVVALRSMLKQFTAESGTQSLLTVETPVDGLNLNQRTALFRVAQEALGNAGRHADASGVRIRIDSSGIASR